MRSARTRIRSLRHEFLAALEHNSCVGPRTGWTAALPDLARWQGTRGRRAGLHQVPFLRRIRLRFRLGRGLRALRPPLLPETHPRCVPSPRPPARVCWCAPTSSAACSPRGCSVRSNSTRRRHGLPRRACAVFWMSRHARPARAAAGCCGATASFTGPTAATPLRGLPRDLHRREAQEGASASAAGWPKPACASRPAWVASSSQRCSTRIYDLHRDTFLRHGHEPYLTRAFFSEIARTLR